MVPWGKLDPMGIRADALYKRLERLIPPQNAGGWNVARLHLEAAAIGGDNFSNPTQDRQSTNAEKQLKLGATLRRIDSNPLIWDTSKATSWRFAPEVTSGADGYFLDVWGRTLSVFRMKNESDGNYAVRTMTEVIQSSTTNIGLARAVDAALGTSGTQVIDAGAALEVLRFNSGKHMNGGHRFNNIGMSPTLYCCFVVVVTRAITEQERADLIEIVNTRKAAGTRLIGIAVNTANVPKIFAPDLARNGETFTATAVLGDTQGVTYHWTVSGGTFVAPEGFEGFGLGAFGNSPFGSLFTTSAQSVKIKAGSGGSVIITLSVTKNGTTSPMATKTVALVEDYITCDAFPLGYAYAGTGPVAATAPYGYSYEWTITGGCIVSGATAQTCIFTAGVANQNLSLKCVMSKDRTLTYTVPIIPFTSSTQTTARDEAGWAGTLEGGAILVDGGVSIAGGDSISEIPLMSGIVSFYAIGTSAVSGAYIVPETHIVDTGKVQAISASSSFVVDHIDYGTGEAGTSVHACIAVAGSDGVFGAWQTLDPDAKYVGRMFKACLVLASDTPGYVPKVTSFSWTVIADPKVEEFTSLTVGTNGVTKVYDTPFDVLPDLQVTILDAKSGDVPVIDAQSKEGFSIRIVNAGVNVARTVNTRSQG